MSKTIQEIKAEFGRRSAEIGLGVFDALAEIRGLRELEEGRYEAELSPEDRRRVLLDQKTAQEEETNRKALEDRAAAYERYEAGLSERGGYLKPRLFGVENSDTLVRVALATDEDLSKLMDRAATSGNGELAKAVFFEATQRRAGDLMNRYFSDVDPEARDLYEEWVEIPPPELLERQRTAAEQSLPRLRREELAAPARGTT